MSGSSAFGGADLEAYRPKLVDRTEQARENVPALRAAWLVSFDSKNTRDAYALDIERWFAWLAHWGCHPFDAERGHADAWARWMEEAPDSATGRPSSKRTINRRMSAASSFYDYAVSERVLEYNPLKHAKRKKINRRRSTTFRPSPEQAVEILRQARLAGARPEALVTTMMFTGARVSEVITAQVDDVRDDFGMRGLHVVRKGGEEDFLPFLPPEMAGGAIDRYLDRRAERAKVRVRDLSGPIFLDRSGSPMTRQSAANEIRRVAVAAECPRLTPHSLRHAFATIGHLLGTSKDDLQVFLGHQSGDTTQGYIEQVKRFENHPGPAMLDHFTKLGFSA